MSTDLDATLASIDATVDGLCACGCRQRLDPGGASAYFARPGRQARHRNAGQCREGRQGPSSALSRTDLLAGGVFAPPRG